MPEKRGQTEEEKAKGSWRTVLTVLVIAVTAFNGIAVALSLEAEIVAAGNAVLVGLGALAQLDKMVLAPRRRWKRQRARTLESILAAWPLPRVREINPYEARFGVFESTIANEYRVDIARPPYVPREVDADLDEALQTKRFVVVEGPSKAGKSRTAFEAILRVFPDRKMLVPYRPTGGGEQGPAGRPLLELAELYPPIQVDGPGPVLWLDGVEKHIRAGHLSPQTVRQLRASYPEIIIMATISDREFESLRATSDHIGAAFTDVFDANFSQRIRLDSNLKEGEREEAHKLYGAVAEDRRFTTAMGEYFAAADELREKYRRGRANCPAGVAVMMAAINWRRAGLDRFVDKVMLRELTERHLPDIHVGLDLTDDVFAEAITWARDPVSSSAALLNATGQGDDQKFDAFDYIVDWASKNDPPVPDGIWEFVLDRTGPEDGVRIGYAALQSGKEELSLAAFRSAMDSGDQNVEPEAALGLGMLLKERGDRDGAAEALQTAIDSGHQEFTSIAAVSLAIFRQHAWGDLDGAADAYQTAIDLGDKDWAPFAAVNLGEILKEKGDLARAVEVFQPVIDSSHKDLAAGAAYNVGWLLTELGDLDGAAEAFRTAIDSGHEDFPAKAAYNLGKVLKRQGDLDGAWVAYKLAIDSGHEDMAAGAAVELGLVLVEQGDLDGAAEAFRTAIDSGHEDDAPRAAFALGVVLSGQGDRDGATATYQFAINSSHPEWAPKARLQLEAP